MSHYAVWRRAPGRGHSVVRAAGRPLTEPEAKRVRLLIGGGIAYLGVAIWLVWRSPDKSHFLPLLNMVWVLLPGFVRQAPTGSLETEVKPEGLPVRVKVRDRRGRETGWDVGGLVHCDGWLIFEGAATRFALTQAEAVQPRYEAIGHLELSDGRGVEFHPLGGHTDDAALTQIVREWSRTAAPEGEAILPPLGSHPEVWSNRSSNWVCAGIVLAVLGVFSLLIGLSGFALLFLFLVVGCVGSAVRFKRRARGAWAELPT